MDVPKPDSTIAVHLRTVAIASGTLGIASLVALLIVMSVTNAEALATIALVVAIVAFVAQLGISLAQHSEFGKQTVQTADIRTETLSALKGIEAAADAIAARQMAQMDRMIDHVIERAVPAGDGARAELGTGLLSAEGLRRALRAAARETIDPPAAIGADSPPTSGPEGELRQRLSTLPTREEAEDAYRTLVALPGVVALHFMKVSGSMIRNLNDVGRLGVMTRSDFGTGVINRLLTEAGLITQAAWPEGVPADTGAPQWWSLTELGIQAARLAHLEWPGWARGLNEEIVGGAS